MKPAVLVFTEGEEWWYAVAVGKEGVYDSGGLRESDCDAANAAASAASSEDDDVAETIFLTKFTFTATGADTEVEEFSHAWLNDLMERCGGGATNEW